MNDESLNMSFSGLKSSIINLVHNETIYPHPPQNEVKQAANKITNLVNSYRIEAIAIGNGTASRETERFAKSVIKEIKEHDGPVGRVGKD